MKNTITEIKNTLERINSRLGYIEELISKLEDRVVEITEDEQQQKPRTRWLHRRILSNI